MLYWNKRLLKYSFLLYRSHIPVSLIVFKLILIQNFQWNVLFTNRTNNFSFFVRRTSIKYLCNSKFISHSRSSHPFFLVLSRISITQKKRNLRWRKVIFSVNQPGPAIQTRKFLATPRRSDKQSRKKRASPCSFYRPFKSGLVWLLIAISRSVEHNRPTNVRCRVRALVHTVFKHVHTNRTPRKRR